MVFIEHDWCVAKQPGAGGVAHGIRLDARLTDLVVLKVDGPARVAVKPRPIGRERDEVGEREGLLHRGSVTPWAARSLTVGARIWYARRAWMGAQRGRINPSTDRKGGVIAASPNASLAARGQS